MSEIESFLTFISEFKDFHDDKSFLRSIDSYIQNQLKGHASILFSLPTKQDVSWEPANCRISWNKSRLYKKEGALPKEVFIKAAFEEGKKEVRNQPYTHGDREFHVFYFGEENNQQQYLFIDLPAKNSFAKIKKFFANFIETGFKNLEHYKEVRRLQSLVYVDDVTGLFNQRKLYKDLDESIERFQKDAETFYVLFIDIDHFKRVNDGHGHLVGTRLLVEVAELIRSTLRDTDLIYRYGGDEYVLILPGADSAVARMVGERLLKSIKEFPFNAENEDNTEPMRLSVSIGLAGFPFDAKSREDILKIADRMMYHAKEAGRGRVCHAGELFGS